MMRKFRLLSPQVHVLATWLKSCGYSVQAHPRWLDVQLDTATLVHLIQCAPLLDKVLLQLVDNVAPAQFAQALKNVAWTAHLHPAARVNTEGFGTDAGGSSDQAAREQLRQYLTDATDRTSHRHAFEAHDGLRLVGGEHSGRFDLAIDLTGPHYRQRFGRSLVLDALLLEDHPRVVIGPDAALMGQAAAWAQAQMFCEDINELSISAWRGWHPRLQAKPGRLTALRQQQVIGAYRQNYPSLNEVTALAATDTLVWSDGCSLNAVLDAPSNAIIYINPPAVLTQSSTVFGFGRKAVGVWRGTVAAYQQLCAAQEQSPIDSQSAVDSVTPITRVSAEMEIGSAEAEVQAAMPQQDFAPMVPPPLKAGVVEVSESALNAFSGRFAKCLKKLPKMLNQQQSDAVRIYDRDLPDFAFAVDHYAGRWHVAEYVADKRIDPLLAAARIEAALTIIAEQTQTPVQSIALKRRERQSGSAQYTRVGQQQRRFAINETPVKLWVNLYDYLDTGVFLDHRKLRRRVAKAATGKQLLNLFCYTGTASVHAAMLGAHTTSVDLSKTYLAWLEDNFRLNDLDLKNHRVIHADVLEWISKNNDKYDVVFLDPPSFSNSKRMSNSFDIQRDHLQLIEATMRSVKKDGVLYFSTNRRKFKIAEELRARYRVRDCSRETLPSDFDRDPGIRSVFLIEAKSA